MKALARCDHSRRLKWAKTPVAIICALRRFRLVGKIFPSGELVRSDDVAVSVDVLVRSKPVVGAGHQFQGQTMFAFGQVAGQRHTPIRAPDPATIGPVQCYSRRIGRYRGKGDAR